MSPPENVTPPRAATQVWDADYRLLVDNIAEYAIFMLDPDGHVASWNLGAERIKGYASHEIVGHHFSRFYPPEDLATGKPAHALETARNTGQYRDEGFRLRKDGSRFWANVVITALRDPDGQLRCFAKITQDLTKRRAEERKLFEAEERFHHLVDAVTEYAIFMLDPSGHVLTWNAGAERTKGYRADEIIGQHFSRFYTPEDRAAAYPNHLLDRARNEDRVEDERWRVRKDGTRFWANVTITALRDKSGELRGFVKVTRDLTDRRAAEEALRRSEERFRLLIEGVTDYAIYMLDPAGVITTWNLGAERLKGYKASEIVGSHFSLLFPPEDVRDEKPQRELATALAQGRFEDEGWRIRKDGSRFWANVIVTSLRDPHGHHVGFAKVTRDLTTRREVEEAERKLVREQAAREAAQAVAQKADEANRVKDEFLATVSHELRTPLNAIVGWVTLLRQRPLDPPLAKGVEVIHRNAQAQVKIIEDILDVSRIVTGKLRLELKPTDLVAITQAAIEVIKPSANAKQIEVEFVHEAECRLVADPDRLQQVVWNLLSNAVKFTPARGQILVGIQREGSALTLDVADTGQGIERDFLPFVFERFKQADATTTRRVGGLGLGLALVRHIVELHGGSVHAGSEGPGTGSRFSIRLPVRAVIPEQPRANVATATEAPSDLPQVHLNGVRVLVVDDDADSRDLLVTVLAQAGAAAQTAASAQEAFEAVSRNVPDVLVSDIGMANEDGYSLMRRVRALGAAHGGEVPSIALSAYTRNEDRVKALAAGFSTHLGKPVNAADLLRTVAELATQAKP